MEARLQLRVQRYGWDQAASHYHEAWQQQLRAAHDTLLGMARPESGQSVIEVAAGTGLVTAQLQRRVAPDGIVLATDLSEEMVLRLAALAGSDGPERFASARCGAEALDAGTRRFDHAICALGLMYVPDPARAVAEMYRVLCPGGRATVTVWGDRRNCGWAKIFPIVDAHVASEVCPMFFLTGGGKVLADMLRHAGFVDLHEHRQHETLVFASADGLIRAVIDGGPVALAVKRFSDGTRKKVDAAFLESVSGFAQPDGSYAIPGEFLTITATRPKGDVT